MRGSCKHPLNFGASEASCASCIDKVDPITGAGDLIHAVTVVTGAKRVHHAVVGDCGGCAARRAALNAAMPFTDEARKDG
jgi:hypothetical protein